MQRPRAVNPVLRNVARQWPGTERQNNIVALCTEKKYVASKSQDRDVIYPCSLATLGSGEISDRRMISSSLN
jgi:hypothetical protein